MDETLLQILEAQDDRITELEEKLASLMARRAEEKAEDAALFGELVAPMLSTLENRLDEAHAGLQAIQRRQENRVGGTDWRPKL